MSRSVTIEKCNFDKLVNDLMEKYKKINNKKMLCKILLSFGEKIGDQYIILNNEYYEECNSYYNVAHLINSYFGCDFSFDVFCNNTNEMICNKSKYEVVINLGIENKCKVQKL